MTVQILNGDKIHYKKKNCLGNLSRNSLIESKIRGVSLPAERGFLFITLSMMKLLYRNFQQTYFAFCKL